MSILKSYSNLVFNNNIKYPEIEISKGDFVFLTGKSGSGKSTYLRILNRTILPSKGSVTYKEKDILDYPVLEYRKDVLLVPQQLFLLDKTIRENFDFYYNTRGDKTLTDDEIKKYLEICCSTFSPNDNCSNMSGGEKQRVFLAIFISLARKVVLLDEPTSALDEKTSKNLIENLYEYFKKKEITTICVSHNRKNAEEFADKIIELEG